MQRVSLAVVFVVVEHVLIWDVGVDSDHFRDNHMDQKVGKVRLVTDP